MLAKITKGQEFYGCLQYVLGKDGAELVDGNMAGQTVAELSTEFRLSIQRHHRNGACKHTSAIVCHTSLSVEIGCKLDNLTWSAIASDYLEAMGFAQNQYILVRHTDTEHDHVHLVISRIRMDGTTVADWLDYRQAETVLRSLEQKYQLQPVESSWKTEVKPPSVAEIREFRRTEQPSVRAILQVAIDEAADGNPSFAAFKQRLERQGIAIRLRITKLGITGISYKYQHVAFPGYKLGRRYTWKGLHTYLGVQYDQANSQPSQESIARIRDGQSNADLAQSDSDSGVDQPTQPTSAVGDTKPAIHDTGEAPSSISGSRSGIDSRREVTDEFGAVPDSVAAALRADASGSNSIAPTVPTNHPLPESSPGRTSRKSRTHPNNLGFDSRNDRIAPSHRRSPQRTDRPGNSPNRPTEERLGANYATSEEIAATRSHQTQSDTDLQSTSDVQSLDSLCSDSDVEIPAVSSSATTQSSTHDSKAQKLGEAQQNDRFTTQETHNLWQEYSQKAQTTNPVEKDLFVAQTAAKNGLSRQAIAALLQQSPYVHWLEETQGKSKTRNYVNLTIRAARQKTSETSQSQQKKQRLRQQQPQNLL